ncbi:hypothetical protein M407DRAFT_22868 [Tulasnella calospora MUT 4182]|uniref:Uncharacterized protein n=1 Tax=Tulasnella calospora MUT 4182 TaxID=1051891 RepID=A0A0C3QBP9_9AGAM|nr:hypothetical protein M407DRAFT_22868 [Tulasnella calospora MUT 4182]
MHEHTSRVVLPPFRLLLEEVNRLEAARKSYTKQHISSPLDLHPPVDQTRRPHVPNGANASLSLQSPLPILPHTPPHSPPIHLDVHLQLHNNPTYHDPNDSMTIWDHRSPNAFLSSPSLSDSSLEPTTPSPAPYFVYPVPHNNSLPGTPRLGKLSPLNLGLGPVGFENRSPNQVMHLQPDQVVEPPPVPPRPILEPTIEQLADFSPFPPLTTSPSYGSSPRLAESRLPFALVPSTSSQHVLQAPVQAAQPVSSKKRREPAKSGKASRAPRVDEQLTKNGTWYSRSRPAYLKLSGGQKPETRTSWESDERAVALGAIERYVKENPHFILSKSSKEEQREVFPVIWQYATEAASEEGVDWNRGYDGFLIWMSKNLDRPTVRNPAPADRPRARKPTMPKAKNAPRKPPITAA